ncbi:hypothetical protein STANM309S_04323 [Streptomyces tanashiensis]
MRKSLSQRRFWKTERSRPRSSARAASARASAAVPASGLSTTTGRPASRAAVATATCVLLGEATTIRSSSSAPRCHSSSGRATTRTPGCAARASAARPGLPVVTAARTRSSEAAISGAWKTEPARP